MIKIFFHSFLYACKDSHYLRLHQIWRKLRISEILRTWCEALPVTTTGRASSLILFPTSLIKIRNQFLLHVETRTGFGCELVVTVGLILIHSTRFSSSEMLRIWFILAKIIKLLYNTEFYYFFKRKSRNSQFLECEKLNFWWENIKMKTKKRAVNCRFLLNILLTGVEQQ